MNSTDRLVNALERAGDPRLESIIERARADYYHDFKGQPEQPLSQLVLDLLAVDVDSPAIRSLCVLVRQGEFDPTPAEVHEWRQSKEGRAIMQRATGRD
jgi:hypothetical protein